MGYPLFFSRTRLLIALASIALAGCTDGLCTRNTDCPKGTKCIATTCQEPPKGAATDAGTTTP